MSLIYFFIFLIYKKIKTQTSKNYVFLLLLMEVIVSTEQSDADQVLVYVQKDDGDSTSVYHTRLIYDV